MPLQPGLSARVELTVTDADTAISLGSGDVPVLGTPRLVALCEEATVAAVAAALEPGQTTVGTRVELDHLAPSRVGERVAAEAELTQVDGRRLTFDVRVGEVARGRVHRVVVDRDRFVQTSTEDRG
jgi:fluoroacetyl-CoA thioesterase